jgi:hypothetical protein
VIFAIARDIVLICNQPVIQLGKAFPTTPPNSPFAPPLFFYLRPDTLSRQEVMSLSHPHAPALHRPANSINSNLQETASTNGLLAYQHQRVPSEMRPRNNGAAANGHARNLSGVGGVAPFEMAARSPPNSSTKSAFFSLLLVSSGGYVLIL